MGLLDVVMFCPSCKRDAFAPANNSTCPNCGKPMWVVHGSPRKWNAMSETEKDVHRAKVPAGSETSAGYETTEYPITTTDSFENAEIEEYLGTVSGTDIYLVGGLVGGGLSNQEGLFGGAFAAAMDAMLAKAQARGANAVVGMSLTVTSPGNLNNIIVIVTGTAVKVRKKD